MQSVESDPVYLKELRARQDLESVCVMETVVEGDSHPCLLVHDNSLLLKRLSAQQTLDTVIVTFLFFGMISV